MLARLLEGGPWPATIAQHALHEIAQVPPRRDCQHVFGDILADVADEQWDAIDDWKLTQALGVGAVERSFEDVSTFLPDDVSDAEGMIVVFGGAADRADRLQGLEMSVSHRCQPPIMTVGQPGGSILPVGA